MSEEKTELFCKKEEQSNNFGKTNATQDSGCVTIKIHAIVAPISNTMQMTNRPSQYNALLVYHHRHTII